MTSTNVVSPEFMRAEHLRKIRRSGERNLARFRQYAELSKIVPGHISEYQLETQDWANTALSIFGRPFNTWVEAEYAVQYVICISAIKTQAGVLAKNAYYRDIIVRDMPLLKVTLEKAKDYALWIHVDISELLDNISELECLRIFGCFKIELGIQLEVYKAVHTGVMERSLRESEQKLQDDVHTMCGFLVALEEQSKDIRPTLQNFSEWLGQRFYRWLRIVPTLQDLENTRLWVEEFFVHSNI